MELVAKGIAKILVCLPLGALLPDNFVGQRLRQHVAGFE